jgi:hypothetical protein
LRPNEKEIGKMRVKRLMALACLGVLIVGISLIIGCGGGVETPTTNHFEASGISFDYPSTWKTETSDDPVRLAFFSEKETGTIVQVIEEDMPSGYTLKTYHDEFVLALMEGQPISGNHLTVSGLDAYETVFNGAVGEQDFRWRVVSLEEDGTVYSIAFAVVPESFDEVNSDFDTVVNSFTVQ